MCNGFQKKILTLTYRKATAHTHNVVANWAGSVDRVVLTDKCGEQLHGQRITYRHITSPQTVEKELNRTV